ncbi:unnamed protein product [Rhizophagus irregularis]|nr:unnamed protein product [Rhizophagus irregularis]
MKRLNLDYQNTDESEIDNLEINEVEENYSSSRLFTSKIHNFGSLPEPRNATEEEQEAFHSKLYDFNIPNNSDSENLPKEFIKLQINSNKIIQQQMERKDIDIDDDEKEITQKQIKRQNINVDDEVYNNLNFHSKEQDELEIPDDGF